MDTERRKTLGKRIKRARRAAGYRSQAAFAEAMHISESSVAYAETGSTRIGASVFTAIETALGWPPECITNYLMTGDLAGLPPFLGETPPAPERPALLDVRQLMERIMDGEDVPEPDESEVDLRDDFERRVMSLKRMSLLLRLTTVLNARQQQQRESRAPNRDQGHQTSA